MVLAAGGFASHTPRPNKPMKLTGAYDVRRPELIGEAYAAPCHTSMVGGQFFILGVSFT